MLVPVLRADAGPAKIDRGLSEALLSGAPTQHVIITVQDGYRNSIRKVLEQHGDVIKTDHPSINALSGEVHTQDIAELAARVEVTSIALDADVSADGLNKKDLQRWGRRNGSTAGGQSVSTSAPAGSSTWPFVGSAGDT